VNRLDEKVFRVVSLLADGVAQSLDRLIEGTGSGTESAKERPYEDLACVPPSMQVDQQRPMHVRQRCWGRSHGAVEMRRGRMGEHGVAVAATVVDDPIRSPSDGDGDPYHGLCPSLYHGLGLELCLCPGLFLGL